MASISIGEERKGSGERGIVHFISICVNIPFASKQTTLCSHCFLISRICKYLVSKFSNFDMRITTSVCGLLVLFVSLFIAILTHRLPNNDSVYSTSCLLIIAPGFMKNCQVLRNNANMCKFWWTNDTHVVEVHYHSTVEILCAILFRAAAWLSDKSVQLQPQLPGW